MQSLRSPYVAWHPGLAVGIERMHSSLAARSLKINLVLTFSALLATLSAVVSGLLLLPPIVPDLLECTNSRCFSERYLAVSSGISRAGGTYAVFSALMTDGHTVTHESPSERGTLFADLKAIKAIRF